MKPVTFSSFGLLGLCALSLTACSTMPTPKTGTNPTGTAPAATSNYTLQSVTVQSTTVSCPSNNVNLKVDCTDNAASFENGQYKLGAVVGNPAPTGTFETYTDATIPGSNIRLNGSFIGSWTTEGNQATLNITALKGSGSFSGGLRLPIKFVYTKK